ncbi:exocyst complex component EXO70A1, partial [Tanacetum coccineum]
VYGGLRWMRAAKTCIRVLFAISDIDVVFDGKLSEGIRVQASEILLRLGEAARGMLNEFENAVLREPSRVELSVVRYLALFLTAAAPSRDNAFEKAGDEKKSKCLEFLLGNHPIELLHPYTMMLQRQNFCSIFPLYCIFFIAFFVVKLVVVAVEGCGGGGGGRLWWWWQTGVEGRR